MKILKKLVIFVEGADGIGKTTIAKRLANVLGLPVIKMVRAKVYFKKDIIEDFSYTFNNVLLQIKNLNYIVDRGPLSSLIYSQIYRRKSKLTYIYDILKQIDPLVIYLTTSKVSTLFERKKTDRVILIADRHRLWKGYEDFFKKQQLVRHIRIDTNNKLPAQIINEILDYLKFEKYIDL